MSFQVDDGRIEALDGREIADTIIRARNSIQDLFDRFERLVSVYGPKVSAQLNDPLSLGSGTWTLVEWDFTEYDTSGFWSPDAPSRITIPEDGRYQIVCNIEQFGAASGRRQISVQTGSNGTYTKANEVLQDSRLAPATMSTNCVVGFMNLYRGTYLEVFAYQNSGATVAPSGTEPLPQTRSINVTRVGDVEE